MESLFLDVPAQDSLLSTHFPELFKDLPYNTIQRRNVSILIAYALGCDAIITIDDDNYLVEGQDFIGDHVRLLRGVGKDAAEALPCLTSSSGWYNVCEMLKEKRGYTFYHRGYPMKQRWPAFAPAASVRRQPVNIVVNAGLWLGDPDVDAITRLANEIEATAMVAQESVALARGTWSPFNSQNTALAREVVAAYCLPWTIGRYDDIYTSYVVKAIADHLGCTVAYGFPLVKQERNPHNYFVDHEKEKVGLEMCDSFTDLLKTVVFKGTTFAECYGELIAQVAPVLTAEESKHAQFFKNMLDNMTCWQKTIARADQIYAAKTNIL